MKESRRAPVVCGATTAALFAALAAYIRVHAVQYREPPADCRVAAFSTCDDSRTNGRVAVFAALKGGDTE